MSIQFINYCYKTCDFEKKMFAWSLFALKNNKVGAE